jgi:hypothetical protein
VDVRLAWCCSIVAAWLVAGLVACANAGGLPPEPAATGKDAATPSEETGSTPPPADAADASAPSTGRCTRDLKLGSRTMSKDSAGAPLVCGIIAATVGGRIAKLSYDCAGDENAVAVIGSLSFTGSVHGNVIDLSAPGEGFVQFDCEWNQRERLQGDVTTGSLSYTYSETVAPDSGCFDPACAAKGTVTVSASAVVGE